jgi:alpha-mannosidase
MGGFSAKSVIQPAYELNIQPLQVKGKLERELKSLLSVDADNVIVEAIKPAEDGDGVIIRLYEAEGTWSSVTVQFNEVFQKAYETNMLEDITEELPLAGLKLLLQFKPFEIKTIKLRPLKYSGSVVKTKM